MSQLNLKNFYVNDNDKDWIEADLVFNYKDLITQLEQNKHVFEANKGRGRISICRAKAPKTGRYASLSTGINPQNQNAVKHNNHFSDREEVVAKKDDDLPF